MKIVLAVLVVFAASPDFADAAARKRSSVCFDDAKAFCPGFRGRPGDRQACLAKNLAKLSPACRARVEKGG
jgi:hypothetical protein